MKSIKKMVAVALSMAMIVTITPSIPAKAAKAKISKVVVTDSLTGSKKQVVVAKGQKVQLTTVVTAKPSNKKTTKVKYSVKNKKIATVSSSGLVKGRKEGKTVVTVTSKVNTKKKATIKVVVKKDAVTGITLNQTTGTLNVGDTVQLQANVTAGKKADKTVVWSSSNVNVLSVSKSGLVTAVAPGSATVTVSSVDGSKKSATYTATVLTPVNMASLSIQNAQGLTFALDNACALDASKVEVKVKSTANGTYTKKLAIDTLTTADNINYNLVVNSQNRINAGDFVQVSVPSLTGAVKSLEAQYVEPAYNIAYDKVSFWKLGVSTSKSFYTEEYSKGYTTLEMTGLPEGLKAVEKTESTPYGRMSYMLVKGTPTKTGLTVATLKSTDELGNTVTQSIKFGVYSDEVMVGAIEDIYTLASTNTAINVDQDLMNKVYGGNSPSGSVSNYYFQIVDDANTAVGFDSDFQKAQRYNSEAHEYEDLILNGKPIYRRYNSSGFLRGSIKAAGDYTVKLRAYDSTDVNHYIDNPEQYPASGIKSCEFTLTIHVKQGITIAGIVKDAVGNPISDAMVIFTNKNYADMMYCPMATSTTNENGAYSCVILPGNYDIEATYGNNGYGYGYSYGKYLVGAPSSSLALPAKFEKVVMRPGFSPYESSWSESAQATNYLYNQSLTATRSGFDISLNLYQVAFVSSDEFVKEAIPYINWTFKDDYVGSGKAVYLKAGTYELDGVVDGSYSYGYYYDEENDKAYNVTYKATVTITNAATQVSVTKVLTEIDERVLRPYDGE
jgi:hypothetical protein